MRYTIQVNMVVDADKLEVLKPVTEEVSRPALRMADIGPQLIAGLREVESAEVIVTDETGNVVEHIQAMPERFDWPAGEPA